MKLSEELTWRGFVNQTTFSDITQLNVPTTFYLGIDPSADSMTIGNLAILMMVRHFINAGHKAYLLIGGATGLIGDPDGKLDERNLKTIDEIEGNKTKLKMQIESFFNGQDFTLVDNYDWFKDIKYMDFLRDVGKHIPMGQMLSRDFVQARLGSDGSGISYAEFSYSLIQGYDFVHLSREYGVNLQLCGADQWGNAVTGVDLVRRLDGREVNVYSAPLIINKETGVKFGKSEAGAIWLDPQKTSVYKFYQFWLNVADSSVVDYLKIYTMLEKAKIDEIQVQMAENPADRMAQKTLAHEVASIVHGIERTMSVERVTDVLFGDGYLRNLSDQDLDILKQEIPLVSAGTTAVEALTSAGLTSSNSEARRLIEAGAISINEQKITADQLINEKSLVKKGKNDFLLVL